MHNHKKARLKCNLSLAFLLPVFALLKFSINVKCGEIIHFVASDMHIRINSSHLATFFDIFPARFFHHKLP